MHVHASIPHRLRREHLLVVCLTAGCLRAAGSTAASWHALTSHTDLVVCICSFCLINMCLAVVLDCRLSESSEVNSSQLAKGFQRTAANLADTALDNPAAPVSRLVLAV